MGIPFHGSLWRSNSKGSSWSLCGSNPQVKKKRTWKNTKMMYIFIIQNTFSYLVDFGFGPVVMDIAKRGIIRFVAKICGTWKRTNLQLLPGFSWLEPRLTASKFAGVVCPQLTHIYSKCRNMICPQLLQQPQLRVSAPYILRYKVTLPLQSWTKRAK